METDFASVAKHRSGTWDEDGRLVGDNRDEWDKRKKHYENDYHIWVNGDFQSYVPDWDHCIQQCREAAAQSDHIRVIRYIMLWRWDDDLDEGMQAIVADWWGSREIASERYRFVNGSLTRCGDTDDEGVAGAIGGGE